MSLGNDLGIHLYIHGSVCTIVQRFGDKVATPEICRRHSVSAVPSQRLLLTPLFSHCVPMFQGLRLTEVIVHTTTSASVVHRRTRGLLPSNPPLPAYICGSGRCLILRRSTRALSRIVGVESVHHLQTRCLPGMRRVKEFVDRLMAVNNLKKFFVRASQTHIGSPFIAPEAQTTFTYANGTSTSLSSGSKWHCCGQSHEQRKRRPLEDPHLIYGGNHCNQTLLRNVRQDRSQCIVSLYTDVLLCFSSA